MAAFKNKHYIRGREHFQKNFVILQTPEDGLPNRSIYNHFEIMKKTKLICFVECQAQSHHLKAMTVLNFPPIACKTLLLLPNMYATRALLEQEQAVIEIKTS